MSETFTASNGVRVTVDDETVIVNTPVGADPFAPVRGAATALREFFQHERDQELGRWRERVKCEFVVYPDGADELDNRCVRVVWESTGTTDRIWENKIPGTLYGDAARNYFAAHPEPKLLPSEPHTAWVDKYGTDIWWVDGLGVLRCCASPSSNPEKYAPFTQLVKVEDPA